LPSGPGRKYLPLLRAATGDAALAQAEQAACGVRHDRLSAALMQAWGLAEAAVFAVRSRIGLAGFDAALLRRAWIEVAAGLVRDDDPD
jgi:hypothetical protein